MIFRHLTFVTFFFAFTINGENIESTTELIEKVHSESDAEAICFVGVESNFLDIFLQTHPNIPVILFNLQIVNITWNEDKGLYGNVLIVVDAVNKDPSTIKILKQLILQLGIRNFAIIIAEDFERLQQYFYYFWKNHFRRIFGIVNGTSFAYFPYSNSTVGVNVAELKRLPDALRNLNGRVIRTSIKLDVPRAFWYTAKDGTRKVGGFVARVLIHFLRKYNGTFVVAKVNNTEKNQEIGAVVKGDLDVTINPYISSMGITLSYPVKLSRWSLMVPVKGYLDPNQYFLRPFSPTVWGCIGVTCLYMVLINILLNVSRNLPANIWYSFSEIYLTMINGSLDHISNSAYRVQFLQKIFAFIIVNFYLVYLTSFLTIFIKVKEYDSVEDLMEANFPVVMGPYDWKYTNREMFPKDFERILVIIPTDELVKTRYSMKNTSFSFGVGIDAFTFLHSVTSKYSKPKFRIISKTIHQALYGFLWAEHAPLQEVLSQFIIRIFDYGLMIKWTRDSVGQGSEIVMKYMDLRPEASNLYALTVKQFRFAWNCLFGGLGAALIVFLGEKFCVKWCKNLKEKRLKNTYPEINVK
ncbi:uncharacterized protein LOC129910866 [Episyrphus balteatus]|uniref:uncharacterized protein LOC129910866 n=1 Tax=Episyrphus balteatus TaxID=286459 RepID=UPI002485A9A7|nr:uncharacterized protein LOC129910866 [Episyrphus balteatus]